MNKQITVRFSIIIWLSLLVIILLANRYIFTVPMYEDGDAAANALQIINAKSFNEIYGNYSRWRFYHPGPFFFYMYAFSEILFYDLIPIFPAPQNSHIFMGIALQLGFFVCALHITANYFRATFFLPLALFCAFIHFSLVNRTIPGSIFLSIWPPHVLLFPFLCFLVSCASLARGKIQHLPIAVFCGSALVHGHVAQPLFTIIIGLSSYGLFLFNRPKSSAQKNLWDDNIFKYCHIFALLIIGIFFLPIFLDFLKGEDSNFANILDHLERYQAQKTWLQGFLYVASFFSYFGTQQILILPDAVTILAERWPYYLVWLTIFIYMGFSLYKRKNEPTIDSSFERYFLGIVIAALILSIVWAKRQDGQMFNFNGFYIFSIPYCILLIFASRFASQIKFSLNHSLRLAIIAGTLTSFLVFTSGVNRDNIQIMTQVSQALQSDPNGNNPKKLLVNNDNWPIVVSVAVALKRADVPFYVEPKWGFLFGEKNVLKEDNHLPLSLWSISARNNQNKAIPFIANTSIIINPIQD
ncbi:MAG: hypothetical protein ACK552_23240 [Microcystis sp.]